MDFIKGYMDNSHYRHLLNDMTSLVFGFSFENWYTAGYYEGEYIPYSYIENNQIIANASANLMKFMYNDREIFYIQIGTVMTRSEYRNQGLARSLIERIIAEYKDFVEGFYLFANLNALNFYEKVGFWRQNQCRYSMLGQFSLKDDFVPAGKGLRERYYQMLNDAVCNAKFDHLNRSSLQMFYTMDMEDVYYSKKQECFAVAHVNNEELYIDSIISNRNVKIRDVIETNKGSYSKVILGFVPNEQQDGFTVEPHDGGNDYRLFCLGEDIKRIEMEKLYFPIMSHA